MIPVMIVEDEYLVRMGLRTTIEWEQYGFKVVADASSAEKGLELYHQHHPFLILTDICMSPMNGLEMIEKIRNIDEHAHFFIVSAYSEFEYAQKAIQYGVDLYIDKAGFSQTDIQQTLEKVQADYLRYHSPTGKTKPAVTDRLPELKTSQWEQYREDTAGWCKAQGLTGNGCVVAAARYNNSCSPVQNLNHLAEILIGLLQQANLPYAIFRQRGFIVLVADITDPLPVQNLFARSIKTVEKYTDSKVCYGCCVVKNSVTLQQALYKACCICNDAIFDFNHPAPSVEDKPEIPLTDDTIRTLCQDIQLLLQSGQMKAAKGQIDTLIQSIHSYRALERVAFSLTSMLEGLDPSLSAGNLLLDVLQLDDTVKVSDFFKTQFESIRMEGQSKKVTYIDEILDYIPKNLHQDLSLKSIAGRFHLSPNYLGKLFHQQTGVHLNNYVASCRMNRACELIRTTQEPIGKIGAVVGIDNPHYFSKLFKDKTGQSPYQYRSGFSDKSPPSIAP